MATESRNPFFQRELGKDGYATFGNAPGQAQSVDLSAQQTSPQALQEMYETRAGERMTLDDVVVKTGILFLVLLATSVVGWNIAADYPFVVFIAAIAGLVLGLVIAFKRTTNPALIATYAAIQGVFLGGVSQWYQTYADAQSSTGDGPNIVFQAVLGTLVAFGVMLALYRSGRLRATPKFRKMMTIALVSYLVIAVMSLFASFVGVGDGFGFYGVGWLGIGLCALGVALAAFSLVLDFDAIEQGIAYGLPEKESWRMGFGLMVTLIWLYLELLRLLAILQGRD